MIRILFLICRRLSTYLVVALLILGATFYYRTIRASRQSKLAEIVFSRGGNCWYDYQVDQLCQVRKGKQQSDYHWLEGFFGRDFFSSVYRADFNGVEKFDFDLRWFPNVRRMDNLGKIHDGNMGRIPTIRFIPRVRDEVPGVFPFRKLKELRTLHFEDHWVNSNDLTWIGKLDKLVSLTINAKSMKQLRPLKQLKTLSIFGTGYRTSLDCRVLKSIPGLQKLTIDSMEFPKIASLVDHAALKEIHISTESLNVPFEKEIPMVKSILVKGSGHRSCQALKLFPNLQELRFSFGVPYELQEIKNLSKLQVLKLPENFFPRNLSFKGLENLEDLNLGNLKGIRLQDLPCPDRLGKMKIYRSDNIQLPPLTKESNLTEVTLNCEGVISEMPTILPLLKALKVLNAKFDHIPQSENLESVRFRHCRIKKTNPLCRFPNLLSFEFEGGRIPSLSLLGDSYLLQTLIVTDTPISNLADLTELYSLRYLSLAGTEVKDLSPLKNSQSISRLDLSRTRFQDLKQLKMFPHLELLVLGGNNEVINIG